jgi:hypothetical protein
MRIMGFGIRVAPGVRISASSRGVRAGIGPRAARIHVGSGKTGFSTGAGPVTYYTSGGSRRRRTGGRAPSMAAYERQVRATERQAELQHWLELNKQMLALAFVHKDEFPDATAPLAPQADPVDKDEVLSRHEREQLAGISMFKRAQRREARVRARETAAEEIEREQSQRGQEHHALQGALDEHWRELTSNDPHTVHEAIEAAFEDNEMPAAVIDVRAASATMLMKIGSPGELIPEREVTQTPTGKPTHKRRTKSVINASYAEIMASHIVATAKEALAVAPSLDEARVLAIRGDRLGGGIQLIPLYAGGFDRASLTRSDWNGLNVLGFVEAHGDINYKGQAQEVAPLPTKSDPELTAALDEIAAHLGWKPAPGR